MQGENKTAMIHSCASAGLSEEQGAGLRRYVELVERWTSRCNLVSKNDLNRIAAKHVADSWNFTRIPGLVAGAQILDVGSGAGFPGLVLACALPEVRFTLVEPRQKRVVFLRHVIRTLGLTNVTVVEDRIEPHLAAWQGRFSHVASRAVAEPGLFLPLIRPLADAETKVVLMLARDESLAGIEQIPGGPWRIVDSRTFALPFSGAPRLLAVASLAGAA